MKCIDIDKDKYNTRINSEQIYSCVSDTLTNLLSKISQKLDRSNPAYMIGNLVTPILKNHPTPLQIALGVLLRESKGLINQLHEYNITCSYSELFLFKKSAAVSATEDRKLQAISHSMIQTVVDNFDADISSQNGSVYTFPCHVNDTVDCIILWR